MAQGRTPFEQIALLLQGGGALGAYQAGVYETLPRPIYIPIGLPGSRSDHQLGGHRWQSAEASCRCVARFLACGLYFATGHPLFPAGRIR